MRKLVLAAVLAVGVVVGVTPRAQAWGDGIYGPYATSAAFPTVNPPGWYTNTYSYEWFYPWYAYYNYSHGPYANWSSGGGVATYGTYGSTGNAYGSGAYTHPAAAVMATEPGTVTVNLPTDAKLLFNGKEATGSGAVRTFTTPPLQPGTEYGYELTAEVTRNGKVERKIEKVTVRAGGKTNVTLTPGG